MASTSEDKGAIADVLQDIWASWPECFITLEPIAPIGADGKPLSPAQFSLDLLNQLLNLLLLHEKKHSKVVVAAAISEARLRRLRAHPTHPDRQLTEDDVYMANTILDNQPRAQRPRDPESATTIDTASTSTSSMQSTTAATASPPNIFQPIASMAQHGTRQQSSGPVGDGLAKMSGCEFVERSFWPASNTNLPRHWLENVSAAAEELRSEFQGLLRPKAMRDAVTEAINARHNTPGAIQHNAPFVIRADLFNAATSLRARLPTQQSKSASLSMPHPGTARITRTVLSTIPSTPWTAAHPAGISYAGKGKGPARASLSSGEGQSAPYRPFASSNGWRSDVTRPAGDTIAPISVGPHVSSANPSANALMGTDRLAVGSSTSILKTSATEDISLPDASFGSFNSPVQSTWFDSTAHYGGLQALTSPRPMQNVTEMSDSSRNSQMAVEYNTTSQVDPEMPDLLDVSAVPYTALLQTSHPDDPQDMSGIELTGVSNALRDVKNHTVSAGISAAMQPGVAARASASTLGELTRVSPSGSTPHKVRDPFSRSVVSEQQESNVHADLSVAHDGEKGVNHASYTAAAQDPAHDDDSVSQSLKFMAQPLADDTGRENGNGPPTSELATREESSPLVSVSKHRRIHEIIETHKMGSRAVWYEKRMGDPYQQSHASGIVRKATGIFASTSIDVQCNPSQTVSKWDRLLISCLNTLDFGTFERFINIRAYLKELMKNKCTPTRRSNKMKTHQYSRGVIGKQNHAMRPLPLDLQHGESVLCRQHPKPCQFPWRKQADSNILPEAKQRPRPLGFRFPNAVPVRQARSTDGKQQIKLRREALAEPECAMTGLVAVTRNRKLFAEDLKMASRWLQTHGKSLLHVYQPRTEIARRVFGVKASKTDLPTSGNQPLQRLAGVVICRWADYNLGNRQVIRLESLTKNDGDPLKL